MAWKVGRRDNRYKAKLVTEERAPCAFCRREVDEEVTYGKLYAIGDIQCHYFCALLSCCLVQKGPEEDGLFGFMYKDILAELERSKKHKCSYCGRGGANLGCSVASCRKQFHLPCGRERNAVSLYYGSYKSFCQMHAPKQRVPEHIMSKAKLRMKDEKKIKSSRELVKTENSEQSMEEDMVCVICYEAVNAFPTVNTFWPPCCARDAWFHRTCLQRMALSAGMHYLKCPLCNDKANFYDAVVNQGYYVPDRDAAWELEQNAFAEIYERPLTCTAEECHCPLGRSHDTDQGMWDIKLCLLCGSVGAHAHCIGASEATRYVCLTCTPAAPEDIQTLADTIEKMILQEQANAASSVRHGPVMPSRMSLRRTKGRLAVLNTPSSSGHRDIKTECDSPAQSPNVQSSRQELNLRTPRKPTDYKTESPNSIHTEYRSLELLSPKKHNEFNEYKEAKFLSPMKLLEQSFKEKVVGNEYNDSYKDARFLSPIKLLEQSFKEKVVGMGVQDAVLDETAVDILRRRFKKPRPLSAKKKIVEDILDGLFQNLSNSLKQKDPVREWCSPRKCCDKEKENQTSANENAPNSTENTISNKENVPQNTPKKSDQNNLTFSTPNKIVSTPKSTRFNEDFNNKETNKKDDIEDKKNDTEEILKVSDTHDDSSNSTFQLSSEFIADAPSDESFIGFETPKSKTIEIKQDSSLEISELDQTVNIDVVKLDDSELSKTPKKCAFKFSPLDKEKLEENNIGIDLEIFKKEYLNEVDKEYKCNFNHNHHNCKPPAVNKVNFRTVIDFAIDAHTHKEKTKEKKKKRKMSEGGLLLSYDSNQNKKRKMSDNDLDLSFSNSNDDFEKEIKSPEVSDKDINKNLSDRKKTKKRTKDKRKEDDTKERRGKNRNVKDISKIRSNEKNRKRKDEEKSINMKLTEEKLGNKTKLDSERKRENKSIDNKEKCMQEKEICSNESRKLKVEEKCTIESKKNEKRHRISKERIISKEKLTKDKKDENRKRRDKKRRLKPRTSDEILEKRKEKYKHDKKSEKHNKDIEVTIDSFKSNSKKKTKTKFSISNNEKDISVKIKWKKKQLQLKIESKKAKAEKDSKFKQYVLQYFSEVTPKEVLVKPEKDVGPLKRKYVKLEKSPDKFRQMSIQNFFKVKSPE